MIDEKAQQYIKQNYDCYCPDTPRSFETDIERAYISGAKENGVVWHDLRKNPEDLPSSGHIVLSQDGEKVKQIEGCDDTYWISQEADEAPYRWVIAWCEVPKFEEV